MGGTYPPGWTVLSIHEVIWLCHAMDIWNPNWTVVKSLFWYHDQILDINCWIHVLIRLYLTQHGHHCGLIWLNIGNLPNTPHISKLKTVLWKYSYIVQRAIPIVDFVGDQPSIAFKFGGSRGHLPTRMDNFVPKYTKWFGYATHWIFVAEIGLLYKVISDIRAKFWIKLCSWSNAA